MPHQGGRAEDAKNLICERVDNFRETPYPKTTRGKTQLNATQAVNPAFRTQQNTFGIWMPEGDSPAAAPAA